jgi:H+-translocating NAD(P) transhydrogenase subunit alpha
MLIGVVLETAPEEKRVAATEQTIKKLKAQGHVLHVQSGAGAASGVRDADYEAAGAVITNREHAWGCELVLKVRSPGVDELSLLNRGSALVGMLGPFDHDRLQCFADAGITSFALEVAPRTSRAQSMDVLSSQANIAGYKAVMLAAHHYPRFFPMLMTAAGTVKAARVVVLGVGVAGLQAIATAKRLGAVIEASDVRPSVKEQVQSLGAKFIDVPFETPEEQAAASGSGGYAKPMPESWLARQKMEVAKCVAQADVVITTALIPGRKAPILLTADMVRSMKQGSVVVDMAAAQGGNCPLTQADQVVHEHGVTLLGYTNLPSLVASDASALYARNVLEFLKLIITDAGRLHVPLDDDIVAACLMTQGGQVKTTLFS